VGRGVARAETLARNTALPALRPLFTRRAAALADQTPASIAAGPARSGLDTFSDALADASNPDEARALLASLTAATEGRTDLKPPASWSRAYAILSRSPESDIIALADALAVRFGDTMLAWKKAGIATDAFAPLAARQAAVNVMLQTQNFMLAPTYHRLLAEPGLRLDALRGLAAYDVPATPGAILDSFASFTAEERRAAVALLAGRPAYARELLAAVRAGRIAPRELDASVARQIRLHRDAELDRDLSALWGASRESPAEVATEIARLKRELTPARLAASDLRRGRELYQATCAACHVLYADGRAVGPDLTGSNRGDLDYLLRNILDPNADIGRDYQLVTAEMTDGRVAAGIVREETAHALTLVNQAETAVVPKVQIRTLQRLDVSLMPPGLLTSLSEPDVADLIAYLASPAPPR
jgi:putative heme-binding domain-containing protein